MQVRLVPDKDDRLVAAVLDDGDFFRYSEQTIEGDQAPRLIRFDWHEVPAGEYEIKASVGTALHVRASAVERIRIVAIH